ncbi:hypothetical protein Tco_0122899 [Tanacetum coccineum]
MILKNVNNNVGELVGRKTHLLEDKKIPSVGVFDDVIWKASGGNTHSLDSIWEETGQDCNSTRRHSRFGLQFMETASQILMTGSKLTRDDVRDFGDDVLVADLKKPGEDSTG